MKKFIFFIVFIFLYSQNSVVFSAKAVEEALTEAPSFPRKGDWINVPRKHQPIYEDKVTLLYFWDYTSINSIREIPLIQQLQRNYKPYGLQVVWIHSPEFEFAQKRKNIEDAVKRFGIEAPVFLDNEFKIWEAFQVKSWPTKYLVDHEKQITYSVSGEVDYLVLETELREALANLNERMLLPGYVVHHDYDRFDTELCGWMTDETYMGYERSSWWGGEIANKRWMKPEQTLKFVDRGHRVERGFFVQGLWTNAKDAFEHARETEDLEDYLGMNYFAREVYVTASRTRGSSARVYVTRDGEPVPGVVRGRDIKQDAGGRTYFDLREPRLYYLIQNETPLPHEIRLWSITDGDAINSFSFANVCLSELKHI